MMACSQEVAEKEVDELGYVLGGKADRIGLETGVTDG